jgi:hypothetical protein
MTDVPGHTQAMVTLMANKGIEFMHIGVNEVAPLPDVPPIFKWKCDDSFITVMYCTSYGDTVDFGSFKVMFAHTLDNKGPQSAEEIRKLYSNIKEKYPDANIKAATLNDVALRLREIKDIPVFDKEIGDTWIFATGSDPKKVGMYRELLRHYENVDYDCVDLTDNLLLVPEHTWGMDIKTYFKDTENYPNEKFERIIGNDAYNAVTKSWEEQRNYVYKAAKELGYEIDYPASFEMPNEYEVVKTSEPDISVSWQLFDNTDYARYFTTYNYRCSYDWVKWDNTKVGLPDYNGGIFKAHTEKVYKTKDKYIYCMEFDKDVKEKFGLGKIVVEKEDNFYTVRWLGKFPSRLPQALWLKFSNMEEKWEIQKLGEWISPDDILDSRLISAFDEGVRNKDVFIKGYDSALVAPFGRHLLEYDIDEKNQDLYFNLYNNIWNTNFPMWFGEDAVYRFQVLKR